MCSGVFSVENQLGYKEKVEEWLGEDRGYLGGQISELA